jgi:hypothetical protein
MHIFKDIYPIAGSIIFHLPILLKALAGLEGTFGFCKASDEPKIVTPNCQGTG